MGSADPEDFLGGSPLNPSEEGGLTPRKHSEAGQNVVLAGGGAGSDVDSERTDTAGFTRGESDLHAFITSMGRLFRSAMGIIDHLSTRIEHLHGDAVSTIPRGIIENVDEEIRYIPRANDIAFGTDVRDLAYVLVWGCR